ncbi:hypothetical protein CFSAN002368_10241 [Clostridium botulinum A1 str. CFSAN002368]|nr:hypothetical protein CFSAN002368_10241 [Clostridium botulinum A1 str. CFSAN002368]
MNCIAYPTTSPCVAGGAGFDGLLLELEELELLLLSDEAGASTETLFPPLDCDTEDCDCDACLSVACFCAASAAFLSFSFLS